MWKPPLKTFVENALAQANATQSRFADARAEVPFTATPGVTPTAWEKTYADAIAAGAVPEAGGASSDFSSALKACASKQADLEKAVAGKKFKDALKLANETEAAIDDALAVIDTKLAVADGYAKSKAMGEYLKAERAAVKDLHNHPVLTRALEGNATDVTFTAPAFTFDQAAFTRTKDKAIDMGVIPEGDTGMRAALKARTSTAEDLVKAQRLVPPAPAKVTEAATAALAAARTLRTVAAGLRKLSKNENWGTYAESAVVAANDYIKTLPVTP